jgi:predicted PurR-regulated permease PerM
MVLFLTGISIFFASEITKLSGDFPTLKAQALDNVNQISHVIEDNFGIETAMQKEYLKDQISNLFTSGSEILNNILNATAGTLFKLFIMPVFVFYLLYYRERFSFFVMRIVHQI